MDNKQEALEHAYSWLAIRLKRAAYVEGELFTLISKPEMSENEKKRYDLLVADNKAMNIKEVTGMLETLKEDEGEDVGFEEFE